MKKSGRVAEWQSGRTRQLNIVLVIVKFQRYIRVSSRICVPNS